VFVTAASVEKNLPRLDFFYLLPKRFISNILKLRLSLVSLCLLHTLLLEYKILILRPRVLGCHVLIVPATFLILPSFYEV
jgi:hypothetical protein